MFDVVHACVVHVMIFLKADIIRTMHVGLLKRRRYCRDIEAIWYAFEREATAMGYYSQEWSRS